MDNDAELELAARIAATERAIKRHCRRNGIAMTPVRYEVGEATAAKFLGYESPDAIAKHAREGTNRVPFRLLNNRRLYRILDIAREIERTYNGGR
jgi:hypothetical protein